MITSGAVAGVVGIAVATAAVSATKQIVNDAAEEAAKEAASAGYFVIKKIATCVKDKCHNKPLCKHPREVQGQLQLGSHPEESTLFVTRIDKQHEKLLSQQNPNPTNLKSLANREFIYLAPNGEQKKIVFVTERQFKKIAASQIASAAVAKQQEVKHHHHHHHHQKHQAVDSKKEADQNLPTVAEQQPQLDPPPELFAEKTEISPSVISSERPTENQTESPPQTALIDAPSPTKERGIIWRFVSFWLLFGWLSWLVSKIRPRGIV